jgi:hypothetical protein
VPSVTPLRLKDVMGALRARRYRAKKNGSDINASVTVEPDFDTTTVTAISTPQMCALAARLSDGRATPGDLRLADKLIMALVDRLPPDSTIQLTDDVPA